ncbi:MAG: pyridoxamine 5'-phosphate oxidase family protein [Candidatus Sumerlaeota bacterium]
MDRATFLEFARRNPVFFLATRDGEQPRVRTMMLFEATEENGIVFCTGASKDVGRQLRENPDVELCFYDRRDSRQVRMAGQVEAMDDVETKDRVLEKFTFLRGQVEAEGYEALAVYRVPHGNITVWEMETAFEPKTISPV